MATAGPADAADVPAALRVYIFEIDWVKSLDETTGSDSGSDEIFAKVVDNHTSGHNTMYTNTLVDMDKGETKLFDHYSRVIAPKRIHINKAPLGVLNADDEAWSRPADPQLGTFAPLDISVALYEEGGGLDGGDDHIATQSFNFTPESLASAISSDTGTATFTKTFTGEGGKFEVRIAVHRLF